ncbi:hypothetical protein [Thermococcus sp.]|uniref:hypothetical protein n=1 Tax=Thermococcus sp. TaxID=35749 RepID=UPI0025CEB5D3|nr:hypothetical protein [Thermococcus sp.]
MLIVEPPGYYPIIDKLFAGRLEEALEPFGIKIQEMRVKVTPKEQTIFLNFTLRIKRDTGITIMSIETIIEGLVEKLCTEATSTFGKLYNVKFAVGNISVVELESEKRTTPHYSLVVDAPEELKSIAERIGKGLIIKLKEIEIPVSALTLSIDNINRKIDVVIKVMRELDQYEKEKLKELISEKTKTYMKILLKDYPPNVNVKILDPKDRALAIVMGRMEDMIREAEELAGMKEIQMLMDILGKSSSP